MKDKRNLQKNKILRSAKECAYLAVFVALVIAVQMVLSAIPGVELVTVMFVAYSFTLGVKRGMCAATAFSLLRQMLFGMYPTVLILYLVYFNFLTACFGGLGKVIKSPLKYMVVIVLIACVCTACFTLLDNVLTPLWLGADKRSTILYFKASLPFMIPQIVCTAVSVATLFYPLHMAFKRIKLK